VKTVIIVVTGIVSYNGRAGINKVDPIITTVTDIVYYPRIC
jgi:hypothetical protein